jgi:hypothetical protein
MQKQSGDADSHAFSHDILDHEAARYGRLVSSLQQEFAKSGTLMPAALFALAEQCELEGRNLEAEFIYLHFINVWENKCRPSYPINFTGLREYARDLLKRALETIASEQSQPEGFQAAA